MIKKRCTKCGVSIKNDLQHKCKDVWNKNKIGVQTVWNKNLKMSDKTKDKLSKSKLGKKQPNLTGSKNGMFGKKSWNSGKTGLQIGWNKGKKTIKEVRDKISGNKNYRWKGGVNSINTLVRKCYEYRQWVQDILKRDDYTCQKCGLRGIKLNAHHIKPFAQILKENNITTLTEALLCYELWDYDNGQTLCLDCHKKTDSYLKVIIN